MTVGIPEGIAAGGSSPREGYGARPGGAPGEGPLVLGDIAPGQRRSVTVALEVRGPVVRGGLLVEARDQGGAEGLRTIWIRP